MSRICYNNPITNNSESRFNIKPISLDKIEEDIFAINDFEIDTLEKIIFNQDSFYIKRILSKSINNDKTKILIIAGVHGEETASVYAIPEILKVIKSKRLFDVFDFEIIYALNPVGLTLFNRTNECNCNINRDFILFKTVQSRLLRNLIKKEKYNYILDLHEGSYDGHYILNNTSIENLSENIKNNLENENIKVSPMLKNKLREFIFLYELDNFLSKYYQINTLDNYLNALEIENILSESNIQSNDFDKRIKGHVIVFENLIEGIKK